jgi:hypothetical protein
MKFGDLKNVMKLIKVSLHELFFFRSPLHEVSFLGSG